MAIPIKSGAEASLKWKDKASAAQSYYEAGIKAPKIDWATATVAAAANYKAGVSAGDIDRRFAGGARKAGTAKWQGKAVMLSSRFSQGVGVAQADYQSAVEPYFSTISALSLPARQPRGSAANYERSRVVGNALNQKRIATKVAGG